MAHAGESAEVPVAASGWPRSFWTWGAPVALLLAFTVVVVLEAWHQSVTVDEYHLVPQAITLRATGDLELGFKTPPLLKRWIGLANSPDAVVLPDYLVNGRPAADGWAPWVFGSRFMVQNVDRYDAIFFRARLMMLPLAWALGVMIFLWARSVGGTGAGLIALALFAFSPEMISFASLVSLDLAVTTLVVAAVFFLREHLREQRLWQLAVAAALFGLALSVKMSAITIAPMFLLPLVLVRAKKRWRQVLVVLLVMVVAKTVALQATYGFSQPVVRPGSFEPVSERFQSIFSALPDWLPIPVPATWMRALDYQAKDVQVADVPSYLDGQWSETGWWYYYILAFLYKTPLPLIALLVFLLAWRLADRKRRQPVTSEKAPLPRWLEAALILGPLLLWGGTFSLAGGLNIGIRYVLPCYAFMYIGIGVPASRIKWRSIPATVVCVLLVLLAGASILAYPHHLSYFNSIAGGREDGYKHLADSNLDWGQELKHLADYMKENGIDRIGLGYFGHVDPAMHDIDYFVPDGPPSSGWYAISGNFLAGYPYVVFDHGHTYRVSARRFASFAELEPVDTLGGAVMIYRVP